MEFTAEIGVVGYMNELRDPSGLGDKDYLHRTTKDSLLQLSVELQEFVKAEYFRHGIYGLIVASVIRLRGRSRRSAYSICHS